MSRKGTPVTPDTFTRSDKVRRTHSEYLADIGGDRRYGDSTGTGRTLGCAAKAARS